LGQAPKADAPCGSKLFQLSFEPGKIFSDLQTQILTIKSDRRMLAAKVFASLAIYNAPARLIDALYAEHPFSGDDSQQHDQSRIDERNLLEQVIRGTGLDLQRARRAILRRATFDSIGDKEIPSFYARAFKHVIEKASGRADKGWPLSSSSRPGASPMIIALAR
jgi:hypothetical protein